MVRRIRGAAPALGMLACLLDVAAWAQGEPQELAADALYRATAPSVHMVIAAGSVDDIKKRRNINQGSAVAIGEHVAITNCHVIKDKPLIALLREGKAVPAKLDRADEPNDICALSVADAILKPVRHIRAFAGLAVGERVYTIGSPRSLENSLYEGLISGLRNRGALRLVQTTAPIAQGSSGGGLFDRFGNLVGITSFYLNEAQVIGFAIAVDQFDRVAALPPPAETAAAAPVAAAPSAPAPGGIEAGRHYRLELAVARNAEEAQRTWGYLTDRYKDLLAGLTPETQRFEQPNQGAFVRLLAGTIADRRRAGTLCAEIVRRGHATCTVR